MASAAELAAQRGSTSSGGRHGHPNSMKSGFSPLARSAMNSNMNTGPNTFPSQLGNSFHQSVFGHAHGRPPNAVQSNFNPPTAPAAMRAGGFAGGTTRYSPSSMQWRANSLGTGMQHLNGGQRRAGGQGLARGSGFPDSWNR